MVIDNSTHLVKLVPLTQFHRLLPAVVALVKIGCNAAELDQLVFFKSLGQRNVIEVVEGID